MISPFRIGNRLLHDQDVYVIAEMSANHNQSLSTACDIVRAMKLAGADAVKLQTYTPDTMTIDCDRDEFRIGKGTIWEGKTLHSLYGEAFTPWDWHPKLFELANQLGMDCFSSPFDRSAVDFLETLNPPAYKIASFELVDLPLIEYVASKGRPIIMSTGMGSLAEISEAVAVVKSANVPLVLLKCTSAYPATPEAMNLRTISNLSSIFDVPVGLSDHTLGIAVPVAAVALGASVVEKHFTLSREHPGPDSKFSLEPNEFKLMVDSIRTAKKAMGKVNYELTPEEEASKVFRRSLFITSDIAAGDLLSSKNVRAIRPGYGLPPKYLPIVLGRTAKRDLVAGTPLKWDVIF